MSNFQIKNRMIGDGHPAYIIAEMSANHSGSIERAKEIIREAKKCGADCVKIQTYTPDTLTINCIISTFILIMVPGKVKTYTISTERPSLHGNGTKN